jgi:hypothetical protein
MPRTIRAAVIHAAADPGMRQLVGDLEGALVGMGCKVVAKQASQAHTPDLAAADLVLLGSAPGGAAPIHPDFSELLRALRGMTLAGRVVGVFSLAADSPLQGFRLALQDCEVPLPDSCFFRGGGSAKAGELAAWLRPLVERAREAVGAR